MWFSILENSISSVVMAYGDAKGMAMCSAGRMIGTLVGAFGGYWLAGVYGFIVGLSLGSLTVYVLSVLLIRKHSIHLGWGDAQYCVVLLCLAGLGWTAIGVLLWLRPFMTMSTASLLASILVALAGMVYQWPEIRMAWSFAFARLRGTALVDAARNEEA